MESREFIQTGIPGFDEMLGGGIPQGHIIAVLGSPGTGKSTFALQFIYAGLQKGEKCVYMSLEENEESLIQTAANFGWDLKPHIAGKKLELVHLGALNMKAAIDSMETDLPYLFRSNKIKRLAIDPITLYEMMYNYDAERRDHLFNFAEIIKKSGITAVLTSETSRENAFYSKYGLIEYIADGVIIFRHVRQMDMRTVTTVIEIQKMRRIDHSREIKPYNITKNGIVVHIGGEIFS